MTFPTLFSDIEHEQPKLPGWCSPDKALTLGALVLAHRPALTVELGVFGGSSFIPMAMAHKAVASGQIVGIDPWDKAAAVAAQVTNEDREWWSKLDMEGLYQSFLGELRRLDLSPWAKIIRRKSDDADVPPSIGLLHVDGGHNEQAIRDVVRFAQHVEIGGYCVMDDLNWQGGAVGRAAQRLQQMGFRQRYPIGTGAVFQRWH